MIFEYKNVITYIHRIDGSTVNEVLINNQAFTEVGGGGGESTT